MLVPDKRICFDYFRPLTTLGVWLEAFLENRDRPTLTQVFELHSLSAVFGGGGLGDNPALTVPHRNVRGAYEEFKARHANRDQNYYDTHCSVLTSSTLAVLINDLKFLGLINLSVERVISSHGNEFCIHLCNDKHDDVIEEKQFYEEREILLHKMLSECAESAQSVYDLRRKHEVIQFVTPISADSSYISAPVSPQIDALETENQRLKSQIVRLEAERNNVNARLRKVQDSLTWKALSPIWRLETHRDRVIERRNMSEDNKSS